MDCCYGLGAGAWDCYAMPYAPYAYYADPYRYYRYDYSHHAHHSEHNVAMEYSAYASKEARMRRSFSRRDARSHTPAHLPIPPTSPLECGMNGRAPGYCDPPMWSHYQMGMMGWSGGSQSAWSRLPVSRDNMRYPVDCRPNKGASMHPSNQIGIQDGRVTPYPTYEDSRYISDTARTALNTTDQNARNLPAAENPTKRFYPEIRPQPVEEKRPPIVPLPAFQQAFGSTERGKFAEAFSRTELPLDDENSENFSFESFQDWENPTENQPQWSATREIKCEENF